jgi:hypothetical protein
MINIIKQPTKLEPASQRAIVFKIESDLATQSEFKYGWETIVGETITTVNRSVGKRFFDVDSDYNGIFTPHSQIENTLSYNVQPGILSWTPATQSLLFYNVKLYESYNPNTFFYEITEDVGNNVIVNPTFSVQTNSGNISTSTALGWELEKKNFYFTISSSGVSRAEYVYLSGSYDGQINQIVTLTANTKYLIEVDFRLFSRNTKMRIQVVSDDLFDFRDFGFYQNDTTGTAQFEFTTKNDTEITFQILALTLNNNIVGLKVFGVNLYESGNFVKLLFNDGHPFEVGDEVRINKTDKTINPQYDGFSFVTDTTTYSVTLDQEIGVRSSVPQTGFIINLTRNDLTSNMKWSFNGRRDYDELSIDFNDYVIGLTQSPTKSFLTSWDSSIGKRIKGNEWETLSLIIATSSMNTILSEKVTTYGSTTSVYYIDRVGLTQSSNRYDIPTGAANLMSITSSIIGPDVDSYTIQIVATGPSYTPISEIFNYTIDKECYYFDPIRVCWKNPLGGIDYFTFNIKNTYQTRIEKEIYTKQLPFEYKIGDRGDTVGNENIQVVWTLNTDYLTDDEAAFLQDMVESPEVYIIDTKNATPFNLIPVVIENTTYDFKSSSNDDELIEYTIEVKEANRKIINI